MKHYLALLLCLLCTVMLLAGCGRDPAPSVTEVPVETTVHIPRDTPEVKHIAPAEAFAGGSGTEADPYQIQDAGQLALLGDLLRQIHAGTLTDHSFQTAWYALTADISLNDTADFDSWPSQAPEYGWEPIGHRTGPVRFDGVLDGGGHTISGIYINQDAGTEEWSDRAYGLFATLGGTVRNLNIEKSYLCISGSGHAVGSVAGDAVSEEALIENVRADLVIEVYGDSSAGGICGLGACVRSSSFSGAVRQLDSGWSNLGGIIGERGSVTDCVNCGTISGSGYSGGIAGWCLNVDTCSNEGSVSGHTSGGICGNMYRTGMGGIPDRTESYLSGCTNHGTVDGLDVAGGIAGHVGNDEDDIDFFVVGCENNGAVTGKNIISGIIGQLAPERANLIKIEGCINHASLTGPQNVGGIVCDLGGGIINQRGTVLIIGCENRGSIHSDNLYAAGILTDFMWMGEKNGLNLTIEDCTNAGQITCAGNAGGILCFCTSMLGDSEISDSASLTLRRCVNTGLIRTLRSNSFAGGIAGNLSAEGIPVLVENCINTGDVEIIFELTEDAIRETQDSPILMTLSQMAGGIAGRLGEGVMLTTDNDEGRAENVNAPDAWIVLRGCFSSGSVTCSDYSAYESENGRQIWSNYLGGIIGNTCAEDAYSFLAEGCGYAGAERGLGHADYPDIGTVMTAEAISAMLPTA